MFVFYLQMPRVRNICIYTNICTLHYYYGSTGHADLFGSNVHVHIIANLV